MLFPASDSEPPLLQRNRSKQTQATTVNPGFVSQVTPIPYHPCKHSIVYLLPSYLSVYLSIPESGLLLRTMHTTISLTLFAFLTTLHYLTINASPTPQTFISRHSSGRVEDGGILGGDGLSRLDYGPSFLHLLASGENLAVGLCSFRI